MRVTMDRVGRVVLPKSLRDQLGLDESTEFDAIIDGSAVRLEPRRPMTRQIREVDGWPSLEARPGQVTTDADIRRARDAIQR
jgi:bifunctional DNA-binding transcriptional regulator/antitoxin component of YhaV-PrlF toxin-antitoxin module